ncbi:hypothetical protein [Bifidobacterium sp. SO1]|uniref:hypothetical protein n=1 Tax=Bifidobacterium sp. SO1 TaxID=2809029 RepID=UPI001BDD62ED|nr:hypothetical protein [Bifidobacterium sp. SO1]MBT1160463.1 hypothetical protein [Bifidobacterium sp. SO1]
MMNDTTRHDLEYSRDRADEETMTLTTPLPAVTGADATTTTLPVTDAVETPPQTTVLPAGADTVVLPVTAADTSDTAAEDVSATIPLYTAAAQPQTAADQAGNNPSGPGAEAGNPQPPSTNQPYIQVPGEPVRPPAVIRKTGPSAATIVLGVCVLLLGVFSVLLGEYFPLGWVMQSWMWVMDPRITAAIAFAGFGGVLVLAAVIWSLANMLHSRKQGDEPDGDR